MAELGVQLPAAADRIDDHATEVLVDAGVCQNTDSSLLTHSRDGGGLELLPARLFSVLGGDRQWDEILVGPGGAFDREDGDEPTLQRVFAHAVISQLRTHDRSTFAGIPALRRDEVWNDTTLELHAQTGREICAPRGDALGEEAVPTLHEHEHRQVFRRHALVVPWRGLRFPAEAEPVEPVSGQSAEIRRA